MSNKTKGIILIALATVIYGVVPILIRITFDEGSNAVTSCVLRFVLALPVLLGILLVRRTSFRLTRSEIVFLFLAGGIGTAGTTLFLNYSFAFIPVGMAATLHFIYPIVVPLACALLFRDKMDRWTLMALVAGVAGVAAFMEPGQAALSGIILALISGVTYAAYIILVDKTSLGAMDLWKLTFYLCLTGAVVAVPCALVEGSLALGELTAKGWAYSTIFSWSSTLLALTFFQLGVGYVGSTTAAIMSTIEPITSIILGIAILGEGITALKVLGCALIIASIVLISRGAGSAKALPEAEMHS